MKRVKIFLRLAIILFLASFLVLNLGAEGLKLLPSDIYVEFLEGQEGFNLFIKAGPGPGSVLITESTADPDKRADSFALRARDYNTVNGDERRILNGTFLESGRGLYFLVDSTPEPNEKLGMAYEIFIPLNLIYGYAWSRQGELNIHQGTWLNIRTFELPYADYRGGWEDNPFVLSMKELPPAPESAPEEEVEPKIAPVVQTTVSDIEEALGKVDEIIALAGDNLDLILVVDTTISMKDDIKYVRESLVPMVRANVDRFEKFRVGVVFYRDYKEAYLTRAIPFTSDLNEVQKNLDMVTVSGGRDINEAVFEGLYAALTEFPWQAEERIIIQIGDADAHEEPRGSIDESLVKDEARRLGVDIYPLRLPDDN